MLAMIWHEIVCWFLKIYQDLKRFAAQEKRIVFVLTFRCAEQFYVPNTQKQSKTGKNPEINWQSFVIWCHNSRKYRSVWYLLSCISSNFLLRTLQYFPNIFLSMKTWKNHTKKWVIIHSWFFPLLPWAAHRAENWKSMSQIGLRHPLLYLLCHYHLRHI